MKCDMQNEERKLRDPGLSALLRDAYADDPALIESPGRSERIMRKIMTAGVQPKRLFPWTPFAWAAGALAAAGVAVALALGGTFSPGHNPGESFAKGPDHKVVAPHTRKEEQAPIPRPVPDPVVARQPDTDPTPAPRPEVAVRQPDVKTPTPRVKTPQPAPAPAVVAAKPDESPVQIASALYTAGDAAQAAGDYESAYQAYDAAYQLNPTPEALLASSEALLAIGQAALDSDG